MGTGFHTMRGLSAGLAAALGACWLAASAPAAADIPGRLGQGVLAAPDLDFELYEAALSPDARETWLVAGARPKGEPTAPAAVVLATFDARGGVVQSALALPAAGAADAPSARAARRRPVDDLAFGPQGQLLVAIGGGASRSPQIVPLPAGSRDPGTARPVIVQGESFDIQELVRLRDGRLLAIGNAGGNPLVAEISASGETVWQNAVPADPAAIDMAAPSPDGGVVVLGRRGADLATQEVWVAKLSAKGGLDHAVTIAARGGSVAPLGGGGYALVTHQAGARLFDVTLRGLAPDMRELWTRTLVADQVNPAFAVAPAADGGFVVAGTKDRGLWVARYTAGGEEVWTEHRVPQPPDLELVSNLALLVRDEVFVLAYTAFTLDGREQRQSVRVIRFEVK